ncbi:hypothetical protein [Selenomonas sp. ND2010]|uniref:hypothetical protein n=1 Tax=Selenomonas sp. ND2010 TaxID=1410618 RepID=UPI00051AE4FB|nr:hypothetical protein [Selenomonas sp. ND2010]
MDINVNVKFDEKFVNALSGIAGCLAAVSMARAGNTNARLPEKTVGLTKEERLKQMEAVMFEDEERPAELAKKAEPKKATKAEEKPLKSEPVTREKAKEINDLVKEPEPKKAEAADKPTTEEIEAIRGKAGEFMKADKATNQPKIAAWLKENNLKRVGEIETRAQIDSLKALIGGDKVA